MVRCCKDNALMSQRVEILNETVDDTLELAEFMDVPSEFCDGVELIEEQNARPLRREFEKGLGYSSRCCREMKRSDHQAL